MARQRSELEIDIRPESDIYETYRRLSYHPWFAMAEFVDNSTWNYQLHRKTLQDAVGKLPYLRVEIFYDRDEGTLSVIDNAHGMEIDEFRRALQLAKPPANIDGRSEFGMGLKTAACWMGPRWRLISKQLGSDREFYAELDVTRLKHDKPRTMMIDVLEGLDKDLHYTRVEIEGLDDYERRFVKRTLGKIKQELASIYRRDIASGEIEIVFNGEALAWEEPELLTELVDDDKEVVWKKAMDFKVGKKPVKGWVGILAKGSAAQAGLHLFRRGRLIEGGLRQGWKPQEIFGAPNSFESQRLIGELDFDKWRVSHTKDSIQMSGADEEELLEKLRDLTADYVQKTRERRTRERSLLTRAAVEHVVEETAQDLRDNEDLGAAVTVIEEGVIPQESVEETAAVDALMLELGRPIEIVFGGTKFPTLLLALSDDAHPSEPLVRVGFPDEHKVTMVLNLNHPFVELFVGDSEATMRALAHLLYVDALVERIQRRNPGLHPSQARLVKDQLLRTIEPLDDVG